MKFGSQEMQDNSVELHQEIKTTLIMEEELKNELGNCGDKWAKCYTYFMIQAKKKANWGPHGAPKELICMPKVLKNQAPKDEIHTQKRA